MFKQSDRDGDHGRSCPCKRLPLCLSSFTAAELGDVNSLQRRVEHQRERHSKPAWRATDSAGNTPLHLAAQHGHVAATAFLLQGDYRCDVNAGSATPLHRASFSGAVATMRLLMDVASCDLLARDSSFGDFMTPLHKAASGGRQLAVQLLLLELENRQMLSTALSVTDSNGHTPLQTARLRQTNIDSESKSVARWNSVAGGPPDWNWCVRLLEEAESTVSMSCSGASETVLPIPPSHLRTPSSSTRTPACSKTISCLQCTDDEGKCRTKSWERAFTQALFQTVGSNLSAQSPNSGHIDPGNYEVPEKDSSTLSLCESEERQIKIQQTGESKSSSDKHSPSSGNAVLGENSGRNHSHGTSSDAGVGSMRSRVGRECDTCHERSLVMYPVDGKSLVCRSCSKGHRMGSNRR